MGALVIGPLALGPRSTPVLVLTLVAFVVAGVWLWRTGPKKGG